MSNYRKPGHYWVVYGSESIVAQYRYLYKSTPDGTPFKEGIWFLPGSSTPLYDDDFNMITTQPLDRPIYRQFGFWLSVVALVLSIAGIALRMLYTCK